jgi:hypothetical protein
MRVKESSNAELELFWLKSTWKIVFNDLEKENT